MDLRAIAFFLLFLIYLFTCLNLTTILAESKREFFLYLLLCLLLTPYLVLFVLVFWDKEPAPGVKLPRNSRQEEAFLDELLLAGEINHGQYLEYKAALGLWAWFKTIPILVSYRNSRIGMAIAPSLRLPTGNIQIPCSAEPSCNGYRFFFPSIPIC